MKFKVGQLIVAYETLQNIAREGRAMPLKGKYRIARMLAKLESEYATAVKSRDELVMANGAVLVEATETRPAFHQVPPDRMADYTPKFKEFAEQEIELDVEAIPFAQLDLGDDVDGSLETGELIALGELVSA